MARGRHPNSLKALEENRIKGQFDAESAVEAKKKSDKAKAAWRSYYEVARENVTAEDQVEQIEVLKRKARSGDIKALELLLKILKEYEDKVNVESSGIEIRIHNVE